jgi:SP family sugar:H+ symporter-like MFS transporter
MGGSVTLAATTDLNRIEAPVTKKAYLICAFAAFGGILFGYDIGYINGVLGMDFFIHQFTGLPIPGPDADAAERANFVLPASKQSLVVSILSAGTFFGSVIAGDFADLVGRRTTIIVGCGIFAFGVALQVASTGYGLLVAGRLVAGIGVGFLSAIVIVYMSEIAPKKVRGAVVSGYQFCLTVGILLASCVTYSSANRHDAGCYRIPFAVQLVWALVLGRLT